jgi:hypothetical protein
MVMNVYHINNNIITSTQFDMVEADDETSLLTYTPATKIFGLNKANNALFYYDGEDWISISSTSEITSAVPNPVTNLILQEGDSTITASWTASSLATYYKVFLSTSAESLYSSQSATTCVVSGLTNGETYGIRIVATNVNGDSTSVSGQATPSTDYPAQVTGVSATSIFITSAALVWNATPNALSYVVYMTPLSGTEVVAGTPSVNNLHVTNLTPNTQYIFTVAAVSIGGEGPESNAYQIQTLIDYPDASTISVLPGDSRITLSWGAAARASSYEIFKGTSANDLSLLSGVSATTYIDTSVTNDIPYYYRVDSLNSTGRTSSNVVSGIATSSSFVEYYDSETFTSFSGMMTDLPYDESPIPQEGRTFSLSISNPNALSGSAYVDYVDLTFANLRSEPAEGLKVYLKTNNPYIPNAVAVSAAITNDASTGWVSATVNVPGIIGTETIRTNTVRINLGTTTFNGTSDLALRMFVPYQTSGNYARTFTTCGSENYFNNSMFHSMSKHQFELLNLPQEWRVGISTISGDETINTTTLDMNNWNSTSAYDSGAIFLYMVPAPGSIPWIQLKWHYNGVPERKIIEMVGDSIMQGYGDNNDILNVRGITGRANMNNRPLSAGYWFINQGQSGFTPEQYLERWEGIAKTTSATALVYSIYSPNGFYNAGNPIYPQRIIDMQNNCILAEEKAAQYGRVFIPCFITNNNMFNHNANETPGTVWGSTWQALELLDWAKARYGNRLIDLTPAIQNPDNVGGLSMDYAYTDDQTHPNTAGYGVLADKFIADFPTAYANCLAAI